MLELGHDGLLQPPGLIKSDVAELKRVFVDEIKNSITRGETFKNYLRYSEELKKTLDGAILQQWINGSFVTAKTNPSDIDFVTFVDTDLIKKVGAQLDIFKPGACWELYHVDAYIIEVHPDSTQESNFTQADKVYWMSLFSTTRRGRNGKKKLKGFLEIFY